VVQGYFLDENNPSSNFKLYMESLRQLFNRFYLIADNAKGPAPVLLINTCGWVTGLGLKILQQITQEFPPTLTTMLFNEEIDIETVPFAQGIEDKSKLIKIVNSPDTKEVMQKNAAATRNRKLVKSLIVEE
jgi:polynucleotide 5'-kinase involved in rRNA processing